jgi:ABC-type uncharacterized transport system substrate-binding protein
MHAQEVGGWRACLWASETKRGKIMPMLLLAGVVVVTFLVAIGIDREATLVSTVVEADQIMELVEGLKTVVEEIMLAGLAITETNDQIKLVHATAMWVTRAHDTRMHIAVWVALPTR